MEWIKYQLESGSEKSIPHTEANLEIAKQEAWEGKYTIEDDGSSESVAEPTADDILNAMLGVTV